jgi:hypothetical protein
MKHMILLAALALASCGDSTDQSGSTESVEEATDVLGESFHESLDSAEAVEGELMRAKENLDAAIEEAEGGH